MSASELLLLKRSFERLDRQYRGAEEKICEFRDKLREARLELATRDRQFDAARKLVAKMGQEKSELAVVAEQNRELSRSLEAKLSLSHDVPELQAKLHRSKRKVMDLTAQLHEAQTRLLMAEEVARRGASEVGVLKRALGLRGEMPPGRDVSGGYEGQAQLLQALAKSQEESASLAAQLAEGSRRTASLEQQIGRLQGEMERLVGLRVAAEEALVAARRETGEAHGRASALQIDLDELKSKLRRTTAHLQEVQAARSSAESGLDSAAAKNRALKEKLQAAEREARAQADALRAEIRALAEHAESEVEALHAQHASREGEGEAQMEALQRQLAEMQARLSQSDRDHEVEMLRLQSRTGALEASLEGSRLREASLERDEQAAREEAARLARANSELAAALTAARREVEAASERAEQAANHTDSERRLRLQVQGQLDAASSRARAREEQLSREVDQARGEVAAISLAQERLRAELKACQEKLSDATARLALHQSHIDQLHTTIQSLTRSKTKLQATMLEQLSLFKSKLQQVEQENLTLRNALSSPALASYAGAADPRVVSRSSTGAGGSPLSRGAGGGASFGGVNLTVSNLAAAQAAVLAGGSSGGSSTTMSSLTRESGGGGGGSTMLRAGGGGSGGGGGDGTGEAGGGGGAVYRSETSGSLVFESSRSEGGMEATLALYDM